MEVLQFVTDDGPAIGTPVYYSSIYGDKKGFVSGVKKLESGIKRYTLGAGGMLPDSPLDVVCVFEDLTETTIPANQAQEWIAKAARYGLEAQTPEFVADLASKAKAKKIAEYEAREKERKEAAEAAQAFRDKYRDKIPADAVAVIVANYEQDDSDVMTDYFSTRTTRTVILAFSKHTRDLFPELRKAARNFAETAHIADADESGEHREKWSMGAGYYLTASGGMKYADGWKIRKERLSTYGGNNDPAAALPVGEWAVPEIEPEAQKSSRAKAAQGDAEKVQTGAEVVGGMTISEHTHTKKGFKMWIVQAPDRVERSTFDSWLHRAKEGRGWYSRKWGDTPAGFAFKDQSEAEKFAKGCDHV